MTLIAKMPPPKQREIPRNEMSQAVCAMVVDCGQHESVNDKGVTSIKPKVMFIFELDQVRSDGQRYVMSQTFTNSLFESSSLRKFLVAWQGRDFTKEEVEAGVDLTKYVGVNAFITPVHKVSKGVTYANIGPITKIRERDVPITPTLKAVPKWVNDFIAKAKIAPDGVPVPTAAEEEGLPF